MQQANLRHVVLAVVVSLLLGLGGLGIAQAEPLNYQINWFSVDGGGGVSTGGGFTLRGVAGQPDAGTLSGGGFTLFGGFMLGGAAGGPDPEPSGMHIFLPQVNNN